MGMELPFFRLGVEDAQWAGALDKMGVKFVTFVNVGQWFHSW